ncbi:MAG: hypothetical protein WDN31_06160 [Hyphomicrobium sp.]
MDWGKVYSYCERGGDPSFWAEPLNAISNGAFIVAGLVAGWQLARSPRKDWALFEWLLIAIAVCIGIGSFMFHTYATVWAIPYDTVPISLFMLGYLGYALRRFAGAPWIVVIAAMIGFYVSVKYAQSIPCSNELLPMTRGAGKTLLQRHARIHARVYCAGAGRRVAAAPAAPGGKVSLWWSGAVPRGDDLPHDRSGGLPLGDARRARRRHALPLAHLQRHFALCASLGGDPVRRSGGCRPKVGRHCISAPKRPIKPLAQRTWWNW